MAIQNSYPALRPSLLLDFANSRQLDPRITFTRSTTATYYDGVTTAKAEENLFTYSQEFDNASWAKGRLTVTANSVAAPDGTTTAETIDDGTASGDHYLVGAGTSSVPANSTYTLSCYAKEPASNNRRYFGFTLYSGASTYAGAIFDLQTQAISSGAQGSGYAIVSSSCTSVGNGWYRCVLTVTTGATSTILLYTSNTATITSGLYGIVQYTGSNQQLYIWGCQIEQRSSATAYTATTTQPITNYIPKLLTAGANQPRFDHNPTTGESLGFLIEEQRTNLVTYSEDLSNAAWAVISCTKQAATLIAPNGTLSAGTITSTAANTSQRIQIGATTTAGVAVTFSVYVKKGTNQYVTIGDRGETNEPWATLDFNNGNILKNATVTTATATLVENGWYRISISWTKQNVAFAGCIAFTSSATATNSTPSFSGTGYDTIFIWGAQFEVGAFPTSYIPTTNASATRAADFAVMQGVNFSSWFNAREGTIIYNTSTGRYIQDGRLFWQIDNNISGYYQIFYAAYAVGGNYYPPTVIPTGSTSTGPNLNAFAFDTTSVAVSTNGSTAVTGSGLTYNFSSAARFMFGTGNVPVSKMAFYPKKLTNINIQSLTA